MEYFETEFGDTPTERYEESTCTERIETDTSLGPFNIVLDVEIYHSDREIE